MTIFICHVIFILGHAHFTWFVVTMLVSMSRAMSMSMSCNLLRWEEQGRFLILEVVHVLGSQNDPFVAGVRCPTPIHGDKAAYNQSGETYLLNAFEIITLDMGGHYGTLGCSWISRYPNGSETTEMTFLHENRGLEITVWIFCHQSTRVFIWITES